MSIERTYCRGRQLGIDLVSKSEGLTIMGIDPGTNFMGYGIIRIEDSSPTLVTYGTLRLDRIVDRYERLRVIFERVGVIIDQYGPDEIAFEAPFFGVNVQSMLKLGRAQGVAMAAALSRSIDVFEYSPTSVKQSISGRGRASKEQVSFMVCSLLHILDNDQMFDATDALAVAICHFLASGRSLPFGGVGGRGFGSLYSAQLRGMVGGDL